MQQKNIGTLLGGHFNYKTGENENLAKMLATDQSNPNYFFSSSGFLIFRPPLLKHISGECMDTTCCRLPNMSKHTSPLMEEFSDKQSRNKRDKALTGLESQRQFAQVSGCVIFSGGGLRNWARMFWYFGARMAISAAKLVRKVVCFTTVLLLDVLYFSCPEAPHLRRLLRWLGWIYELPGGQKFSFFNFSLFLWDLPQKRPLNSIKKTAIYKPPPGCDL